MVGRITVASVLAANLLSNFFAFIAALAVWYSDLSRRADDGLPFKADFAALRNDVRYGLSAHVGTLQPFSNMQLDVLLLSSLISPHEVGLYAAALAGANVIKAQGTSLGYVVLPDVARHRDARLQRQVTMRLFPVVACLSGMATLVAYVWGDSLVRLVYGPSFAEAAPILKILMLGSGASILYRVTADSLRGMGKPLVCTVAELLGVAVGVAGILLLVPSLRATGGAAAVSVASFVSAATVVAVFFRMGGVTMATPLLEETVRA
jgi:O-antigen/teichoic acid export membrane protein